MANYHVTKNKDRDIWQAKREHSSRVSGFYNTQVEAEKAAKEFSGNNGGGEVRIHRQTGPIRDSDTVKPGHDPYPPKDQKH